MMKKTNDTNNPPIRFITGIFYLFEQLFYNFIFENKKKKKHKNNRLHLPSSQLKLVFLYFLGVILMG